MSWLRNKDGANANTVPLPSARIGLSTAAQCKNHDAEASNGGHGTDDTLRVIRALEEHGIICCLVGVSALIFYGAARVRSDWEICVPTNLVDNARDLFQSDLYSADYFLVEPWAYRAPSIVHTYSRFKSKDKDHHFVLVPSNDAHLECEPSNITRSLRGLPYPTLPVFVQSSLDMKNMVQLVDVVDGTNVSEEWGEENLELEGTNDVEWARELNQRGETFDGGKYAHWGPFVPERPTSKREMWREVVRTKEKRLDWTKPKDVFVTQHRLIGDPDSWTLLSDMY